MSRVIFNGRERRSYVRVDALLPVRFRLCGLVSAKIYSGATKNVSQGGLCLEVLQNQDELIETVSSMGDGRRSSLSCRCRTIRANHPFI